MVVIGCIILILLAIGKRLFLADSARLIAYDTLVFACLGKKDSGLRNNRWVVQRYFCRSTRINCYGEDMDNHIRSRDSRDSRG